MIGYHAVILNGMRHWHGTYNPKEDGLIESGRPYNKQGAHVKGQNKNNLGICIIGYEFADYTIAQLNSLLVLCRVLMQTYNIAIDKIKGHKEYDQKKPVCPDISMPALRAALSLPNYRIG